MNLKTTKDKNPSSIIILDVIVLIVIGILLYAPFADFFGPISQGDNGVDLYAAQEVLRGHWPYIDFSWSYGPLMPFYAALFFKIFGVGINSLILARLGARMLSGIFLYLTARTILPRSFAMLAAIWFWSFYSEFIHTINHTLGISFLVMTACALFYFAKTRNYGFLWWGLIAAFVLSLIKLNFGLTALVALTVGHAWIVHRQELKVSVRRSLSFYSTTLGLIPFLIFVVYWSLLHSLPDYAVRQSLPYGSSFVLEEIPWSRAIMDYFARVWSNLLTYPWHAMFGASVAVAGVRVLILWIKRWTTQEKAAFVTSAALITLFYLAAMHEFIRNGTSYRAFWTKPFTVLLFFFILHRGFTSEKAQRWLLVGLSMLILWGQAYGRVGLLNVKTPAFYLKTARANVYVYNRPDWIRTVEETTEYLNRRLKPDEHFLALPHDEIYYFLTGRPGANRQLNFFAGAGVTAPQEDDVIKSLERHNVRYIVLSNRSESEELGYGVLGRDYCPRLKQYIDQHFEVEAQFGEWSAHSRWSWNHAVKILRRKDAPTS